MYLGVRVCIHTHTHTHCTWGARCEPRSRDAMMRRLEGLKNPNGLNLSKHVFVFVYTREVKIAFIIA